MSNNSRPQIQDVGGAQLVLASENIEMRIGAAGDVPRRQRPEPLPSRITDNDRKAHRAFIATLGERPIWNGYLAAGTAATRRSATSRAERNVVACEEWSKQKC
jgi:hypothetical protein